jgi:predicted phage-related endonuclease
MADVGTLVTPTGVLLLDHTAPHEEWLDKRREGIGSSDLPSIMQLSDDDGMRQNHRSPLHVYYDKTGAIPHDVDNPTDAMRFGLLFEEPLAFEWARRNRTTVEPIGIVAHRHETWQMCSLDRLCRECPLDRDKHSLCALEVKTRNAFTAKLWRDGPPDDVLAQVLWQILVTGLDHIHVVCLIGNADYRQYVVRRSEHERLVAFLDISAARLWFEHIVARVPPPLTGDEPADDLVELYQRLHPTREGVIEVDRDLDTQDLLTTYLLAGAAKSEAEDQQDAAKAQLYARLGKAQAATVGDRVLYSIDRRSRRKTDLARLAERHPEAFADCVSVEEGDHFYVPAPIRKEYSR